MSLMEKAKSLLSQNKGKVGRAVDQAGTMVDKKTGGKYHKQVGMGEKMAKNYLKRS